MTSPIEFAERRGDPRPRPKVRVSLDDAGALVVLLAILYTAVPVWASSDGGRDMLAREIETLLDGEIRGYVSIGSLDRVDSRGVAATHVVFYDESGRVVIEADEVELDVDWDELVHGHVVSPRGRAHGGRVVMETLASGELLIDRAFESAHPGPPGSPVGDDVVRLERFAVDGVDVLIALHGAAEISASHLSSIMIIRAPENGSARMRADRIGAELHIASPIPQDLVIENGHFELDGASRRRARIDFPTHVGGEPLHLEVAIRADSEENMHLAVTLTPQSFAAVFTSTPLIAQAMIFETMSDNVDVTVELP